ncbi:MAG: hypothetical protein ACP5GX_04760 [Anaerolineae bacterium]
MRNLMKIFCGLALLSLTLTVGCGATSSLQIGWVETSGPNSREASYRTFTGIERKAVELEAGEILAIDYNITVDKGELDLRVENPDGDIIWEQIFGDSETGTAEVRSEEAGRYLIEIEGQETGGSYELSWQTE